MCSKVKLDLTKLWYGRLGHINYRNLVHIVNNDKVRGIPKLSGQPKPIFGKCMKGKHMKSSHKKHYKKTCFSHRKFRDKFLDNFNFVMKLKFSLPKFVVGKFSTFFSFFWHQNFYYKLWTRVFARAFPLDDDIHFSFGEKNDF